ncbi:MAG TPA: hypothetical protein VGX25_28480 [Actinophytocola sp.]|uniref:hypothetical protein n=1 Tax=Actinophytocola sp. TaxID=1872138 RepID=UPI002DDCF37D|nr:hypothetical protein [Actinophytocola sp.]HEV2783339.1 hypothetical protein [Actinophytocola sp.]
MRANAYAGHDVQSLLTALRGQTSRPRQAELVIERFSHWANRNDAALLPTQCFGSVRIGS